MKKQNLNLVQLIKLLSISGYHDGNKLGQQLGITRSAVWKNIKKLQAYGVNIQVSKGLGYQLAEELVLYEQEVILTKLQAMLNKSDYDLLELTIFENIPSTSDYLKTINSTNKISVCMAEEQTAGRGRFARPWYSPFGQNIYLSIGLNFAKDISSLVGVSLIVGLAVLNAIKALGVTEEITIKWPNDIFYKDQKLAGILIDADAEINGSCKLIIGVGLNLNMLDVADTVASNALKPWVSLKKIVGATIDKNNMTALLISKLIAYVKEFTLAGFSAFMSQWDNHDYLAGKAITIDSGNITETGICQGIDQQGRLLLQLSNGTSKAFASGDATILER